MERNIGKEIKLFFVKLKKCKMAPCLYSQKLTLNDLDMESCPYLEQDSILHRCIIS